MQPADGEDKTSVIFVANEFLDSDASLPTFLAFSEEQKELDDETTALLRMMRRSWFGGRVLRELKCYLECLVVHKIPLVSIADNVRLSKAAVSNWYRKAHSAEAVNLELLRRVYGELLDTVPMPSKHDLDLHGYLRAISDLMAKNTGSPAVREMSVFDFWCLFFAYRRPTIRHLWAAKKEALLEQVCRDIWWQASRLRKQRSPEQDEMVSNYVLGLMKTCGEAYMRVVLLLDDVCWTGPDAG